jgi:hypothetical protein
LFTKTPKQDSAQKNKMQVAKFSEKQKHPYYVKPAEKPKQRHEMNLSAKS